MNSWRMFLEFFRCKERHQLFLRLKKKQKKTTDDDAFAFTSFQLLVVLFHH